MSATTDCLKPIDHTKNYYVHPHIQPLFGVTKICNKGICWLKNKSLPIAIAILTPRKGYEEIFESELAPLKAIKSLDRKHEFTAQLISIRKNQVFCEAGMCDLGDFLEEEAPFPKHYYHKKILGQFAYQILSIGNFLHQHNYIHRDVKPHNFIIVNGSVKIIDFATLADSESKKAYEVAGTDHYFAPELHREILAGTKLNFLNFLPVNEECWRFGIVVNQVLSRAEIIPNICFSWTNNAFYLQLLEMPNHSAHAARLRKIEDAFSKLNIIDPLGLIQLDPLRRSCILQARMKLEALINLN